MTPQSHLDSRVIAVTPDLIEIAGDGNAAIFLAQVLFWWRTTGRKKFYKFNAPCDHALYRPGDSWAEELRFKRAMFATARRRVATKVRVASTREIQSAFSDGALVVYGTDEHHLTWYIVNEQAVQKRSPALFHRLFNQGSASAPTPGPKQKAKSAQVPGTPIRPEQTVRAGTTVSAAAAPLHPPMQEECSGYPTERTSEKASEISFPVKPPLPTPHTASPVGEGGESKRLSRQVAAGIITGLQQRGVQEDPARLIARRAVRCGYTEDTTLEIFDAHVLDAKRANAMSPIGVAVSRMSKNSNITPAPTYALEKVRQRRRRNGNEPVIPIAERGSEFVEFEVRSENQRLWDTVLRDIKLQLTRATFDTHLRSTSLEREGGRYVVCSRNPHAVEWLDRRLNRLVKECLQQHTGAEVQLTFAYRATDHQNEIIG